MIFSSPISVVESSPWLIFMKKCQSTLKKSRRDICLSNENFYGINRSQKETHSAISLLLNLTRLFFFQNNGRIHLLSKLTITIPFDSTTFLKVCMQWSQSILTEPKYLLLSLARSLHSLSHKFQLIVCRFQAADR